MSMIAGGNERKTEIYYYSIVFFLSVQHTDPLVNTDVH